MSDKITGIRCSHYVPNAHAVCSNIHAILHLRSALTTLHLEGNDQLCWGGKSMKVGKVASSFPAKHILIHKSEHMKLAVNNSFPAKGRWIAKRDGRVLCRA